MTDPTQAGELFGFFEPIAAALKGQWLPAALMVLYRVEKSLYSRYKARKREQEEAMQADFDDRCAMAERSIARGISNQIEIAYSKAFEGADSILQELHNGGNDSVISRTVGGEKQYSITGYLTQFTKELKTYTFKKMERDLSDYVADDKTYYCGDKWEGYTEDKAEDIRRLMKTALGKRLGVSEVLDRLFDEHLTYEFFLNSYTKLINMARDNQEYL